MNRTKAREYAFILIFQYKFQPEDIRAIFDEFAAEYEPGNQKKYIEKVVMGVAQNTENIDEVIAGAAKGWDISSISCVSLAVLRLAVYEIMYCDDIPGAVSVNEAVSLAKKYDSDEAAPFVNGVLGGLDGVRER